MAGLLGAVVAGWVVVAGAGRYAPEVERMAAQLSAVEAVLAERSTFSEGVRREIAIAILEEAARAGYDPFLVLGIIDVESDFRHDVVSSADARGLMQIQPVTLAYLIERQHWPLPADVVARSPALSVRLGVRYVRQLHDRFHSLDSALMAYNMGPTKFARLRKDPTALDEYRVYPKAVRRDAAKLKARSSRNARPLS